MDVSVAKSAEISAVVIRCGCGDPSSHPNSPCPKPRAEHDLGVVSRISDNPFKRLLWALHGKAAADRRIQEANRS